MLPELLRLNRLSVPNLLLVCPRLRRGQPQGWVPSLTNLISMNKISTVALIAIALLVGGLYVTKTQVFGGAVTQVVETQGVWIISDATSTLSTLEQTGSLNAGAVNSSTTMANGVATQVLAQNFGRAYAAVCTGGSAVWMTLNNTVTSTKSYAVGSSTITNANWFVSGVGRRVASSTCIDL